MMSLSAFGYAASHQTVRRSISQVNSSRFSSFFAERRVKLFWLLDLFARESALSRHGSSLVIATIQFFKSQKT